MDEVDFSFSLLNECDSGHGTTARAGIIETAHCRIPTPVFMPVGTHAIVRGHHTATLEQMGFPVLLANTYHLLLRPGPEVFLAFGGIHEFMKWPRSILTDSGGFQVFSLARHINISDQGAELRSYVDGRKILLTPELSIETQKAIGSDIMMVLDQCIPSLSDRSQAQAASELTFQWAKRSLAARGDSRQALFGIVQGASFLDLRRICAEQITSLPFDGYAIGGVAVGDDKDRRDDVISYTSGLLPRTRPRYLMGVGTPSDLLEAVSRGMDMFDCILPTALAQQGVCFTRSGKFDLKRSINRFAKDPIDPLCKCSTCTTYSKGYLHHLIKTGETMGGTLAGIHNLSYYSDLMGAIRESIISGVFADFYKATKTAWLENEDSTNKPAAPTKRPPRFARSIGDYELMERNGVHSIRQTSSGEIMHSVSDPLEEAQRLYVNQSQLRERLEKNLDEPLVIWDVGLGAGTNALAAIFAYEEMCLARPDSRALEIISFENDLDSLKLALLYPTHFKHVRHAAPHAIIEHSTWKSEKIDLTWKLLEGDFFEHMEDAPAPDLIFYDPFSYKADSELWSSLCFERLFACCKPGTALFTYSASTAVRACLLGAGFWIARGVPTGPKEETTIAIVPGPDGVSGFELLGSEWLSRWERSQSMTPEGMDDNDRVELIARVRNHPQFRVTREGVTQSS